MQGAQSLQLWLWATNFELYITKELHTKDKMVEGVRSRLLDTIRVCPRADVKVGVALSDGIGSSVVAGMVNQPSREGE